MPELFASAVAACGPIGSFRAQIDSFGDFRVLFDYFGSKNDLRLNLSVKRFTASPAARAALHPYETSGDLSIPLVTLHTTRDEVIPFWHELLYLPKVKLSDRGRFIPLPVFRYGHCNFTSSEVVGSFLLAIR